MTKELEDLIKELRAGQKYDPFTGDLLDMSYFMDEAADILEEALAQPDECPNLKHCQGLCFVCEYWNSETGEMEYPAQSEQTEQSEQSEQPKQEPVAYIGMISNDHFIDVCNKSQGNSNTALYSYAPKRKWVSLTNDDIFEAIKGMCSSVKVTQALIEIGMDEYTAIEAKVKELNYDKY